MMAASLPMSDELYIIPLHFHFITPIPHEKSPLYHAGTCRHRPFTPQAIEVNGTVYVSGQLPVDPATGEFVPGGIKELTHRSLTNLTNVLAEAGLTLDNVVKTTVFLADIEDFAAMNEVYASFFKAPFPARSAMAVKTLPKGARVEIECIAVR